MTKYETIYDAFQLKMMDYNLAELSDDDIDNYMRALLKRAEGQVSRVFLQNGVDLSEKAVEVDQYGNETVLDAYAVDLTEEEIDILSEYMTVYRLQPYVNNSDLLRNYVNTKDFTTFSSANLLTAINSRYMAAKREAHDMLVAYSFTSTKTFEMMSTDERTRKKAEEENERAKIRQ